MVAEVFSLTDILRMNSSASTRERLYHLLVAVILISIALGFNRRLNSGTLLLSLLPDKISRSHENGRCVYNAL